MLTGSAVKSETLARTLLVFFYNTAVFYRLAILAAVAVVGRILFP